MGVPAIMVPGLIAHTAARTRFATFHAHVQQALNRTRPRDEVLHDLFNRHAMIRDPLSAAHKRFVGSFVISPAVYLKALKTNQFISAQFVLLPCLVRSSFARFWRKVFGLAKLKRSKLQQPNNRNG
jgi:hypothetical protein